MSLQLFLCLNIWQFLCHCAEKSRVTVIIVNCRSLNLVQCRKCSGKCVHRVPSKLASMEVLKIKGGGRKGEYKYAARTCSHMLKWLGMGQKGMFLCLISEMQREVICCLCRPTLDNLAPLKQGAL